MVGEVRFQSYKPSLRATDCLQSVLPTLDTLHRSVVHEASPLDEHRKKLRRDERRVPRYLTFSCYQRRQLLGTPQDRDEFARRLSIARDRCGFRLLAWVTMPEHVHMIVVPTDEYPVPKLLVAIKQPVAQTLLRAWQSVDSPMLQEATVGSGKLRFWQAGGGFDRNVRDHEELEREIAYIHHNPVRRGLVKNAKDWAWSSARWYEGEQDGGVPIDSLGSW